MVGNMIFVYIGNLKNCPYHRTVDDGFTSATSAYYGTITTLYSNYNDKGSITTAFDLENHNSLPTKGLGAKMAWSAAGEAWMFLGNAIQ